MVSSQTWSKMKRKHFSTFIFISDIYMFLCCSKFELISITGQHIYVQVESLEMLSIASKSS